MEALDTTPGQTSDDADMVPATPPTDRDSGSSRQPLVPVGPAGAGGAAATYTPLVPSFSPFTSSAEAAVRLAWRWTVTAFAALVVLVVGGPLARNWYVSAAIEPRPTEMTLIDGGVVFLQRGGAGDFLMARPDEPVKPGDVLRTAGNSRAFLRLFDQSTVLLFPSTSLRVLRAEQGRFRADKQVVVLEVTQGKARIGVAPADSEGDGSDRFFQLRTPGAEVHLDEGSYSVDVGKPGTQVAVRLGSATAHTARGEVSANTGQRLVVSPDHPPAGNQPARRDLLENGFFAERDGDVPTGWSARDVSEQDPAGIISLNTVPGAVTFQRHGQGHGESLISQTLDLDLWDFEKVNLVANVRVLQHNLSGGGWQGTEFPLMLRVVYRDATGSVVTWYHGYYLTNPEGYPVRDGEQLPSTDWKHVEIDLLSLVPRPWRIQRVEVVATGWDYTSAVSEVHVWAE